MTIQRRRKNSFEEAMAKLIAAAPDAVTTLRAALFDPSASIRIRAAAAILNFGTIFAELKELERRLNVLERRK